MSFTVPPPPPQSTAATQAQASDATLSQGTCCHIPHHPSLELNSCQRNHRFPGLRRNPYTNGPTRRQSLSNCYPGDPALNDTAQMYSVPSTKGTLRPGLCRGPA
jgi:hypothetical protein